MAYQPRSRSVQRFPLLFLVTRFLRLRQIQIKIRGDPGDAAGLAHAKYGTRFNKPNRETNIQPTAVFLPTFSRNAVGTKEDIRLTQLYRFPTVCERISGRVPGEMHRNRIYFGFFPIVPGRNGAHYILLSVSFPGPGKGRMKKRTNGKEEWASSVSAGRCVQGGIQQRHMGLHSNP